MLILNNIDGGFLLAPEKTREGERFLGVQRIKIRYKAGDMEYIYLPFEKDTLRLQEDFGGLPVFKQTMREETPYMMNPVQSVYQTNKIQDMKHVLKESTEEENIFSTKVISSDDMSMADILEADRNVKQKQLITPIEFF